MKLWNNFHAPEDIEPALDESLTALDTEYLDLYLIHWSARTLHIIGRLCSLLFNRPIAQKQGSGKIDWDLTLDPYPTWKKLEELVDKGKIRNIGISKCVSLEAK